MVTQTISRTDLARRTREVIEKARQRGPVMVESYGEEQVAVLDALDFRLLQAVVAYHGTPTVEVKSPNDVPAGLTTAEVEAHVRSSGGGPQAATNLILAAYLDGVISLGRAAELLGLTRWDLLDRLTRLDIPIRDAFDDLSAAVAEAAVLRG